MLEFEPGNALQNVTLNSKQAMGSGIVILILNDENTILTQAIRIENTTPPRLLKHGSAKIIVPMAIYRITA